MNNSCPRCDAVYNVAAKDIGRKIRCKKCSTALIVTDAGLEEDRPGAPPPEPAGSRPAAALPSRAPAAADDEYDDEPVVKKGKTRAPRGPGINPIELVGGVPTLLFAFGVFLVIVFTSLPIIGAAGSDRAAAYVDKLKLEANQKKEALLKGKKMADLTDSDRNKLKEDRDKIDEDYAKKMSDAAADAEGTRIGNRRDVWMERYGLMFGFIFVAFGCIGYLRTEQPLILKIVMGFILAFMLMVMFGTFGVQGCVGGRNPLG